MYIISACVLSSPPLLSFRIGTVEIDVLCVGVTLDIDESRVDLKCVSFDSQE